MVNFPVSLDALTNPAGGTALAGSHAAQHGAVNDILEALEAKLGISASTPTNIGDILTVTALGATGWLPPIQTNPVLNGGFEVWQRGTLFPNITTAQYTADRWNMEFSTGTANPFSVAQQIANLPTVSERVPATSYAFQVTLNAQDISMAAGEYSFIRQQMEGYNWRPFWQQPFTIGFWVRSSVTGTYSLGFISVAATKAYVAEYTINSANTWEYKTVTVPASPSAGSWNLTNGTGIYLSWCLSAGSSQFTTLGAWQSATTGASANQVNFMNGAVGSTFSLWGITLGLGTTVAPYWPRPYASELQLCERYYERMGQTAYANEAFFPYAALGTTGAYSLWKYRTAKRTQPSHTSSAVGTFTVNPGTIPTAITFSQGNHDATLVVFTSTTTNGFAGLIYATHNPSQAWVAASAEL